MQFSALFLKAYILRSMWCSQWHPTAVLLPGKSHGRRSLVGCSPWRLEESGTTERRHFHFSLSCIGEGNGNSLQCSCLENPRDGGAWWAAVSGVAQSQTRLKRLSSSSSRAPSFRDETVSKNQAQLLSLPYNSRKQIFILLVIYPMYKMEFPFWIDLLSRHFSYSYFMPHMAIHTQ